MIATNIFKPRNDWDIRAQMCKRYVTRDKFVLEVVYIIMKEMNTNPLDEPKLRERKHVEARQMLFTMVYNYTTKSLADVGAILNKDHATVLHGIKTISNLCDTDRRFKAIYERINRRVKQLQCIY